MKNKKYLKSRNECYSNCIEGGNVVSNEMLNDAIYENIYLLKIDVAEYVSQREFYEKKIELTKNEILRLESLLRKCDL